MQYEKVRRKEIINNIAEIIDVADINIPELEIYTHLTDARLRKVYEYEHGIFIAKSQTVIEVALDAGCKPISMLTDRKYINDRANGIIERCGDIPVYTADSKIMSGLTGYELTRGILFSYGASCAEKGRGAFPETHEGLRCWKLSPNVSNPRAMIGSAAALGIDAVLITPSCCHPILAGEREVVSQGNGGCSPFRCVVRRISLGGSLFHAYLNSLGFKTAAMALTDNSVDLMTETLEKQEKACYNTRL
ncbi:MAG: RNA methyltransferase [Dorea sp.]